MESFGVVCWFISFICFSVLGIRLWGEAEEFKIWEHKIRARNANLMSMAMYKIHNVRVDNIEILRTGKIKRLN